MDIKASRFYRTRDSLPALVRNVTIPNPQGLHARPVMKFVDIAGRFQSSILVQKGGKSVDGKNPMEMMLLEATQGTVLELHADGPDAEGALEALTRLVADGFGEM
ncbi:MAG: HPr family phosphocarrier protein [Phycisphaerae bacterium]|jgi:phosphocarrier protein